MTNKNLTRLFDLWLSVYESAQISHSKLGHALFASPLSKSVCNYDFWTS